MCPVAKKSNVSAYAIADEGEHFLYLLGVDEQRLKPNDPSSNLVWFWNFESSILDADGKGQKVRKMTSADLKPDNDQRALWEQLLPGVEFEDLTGNTDEVVGKWYDAVIEHSAPNAQQRVFANIVAIKPVPPKPAEKPAAPAAPKAAAAPRVATNGAAQAAPRTTNGTATAGRAAAAVALKEDPFADE